MVVVILIALLVTVQVIIMARPILLDFIMAQVLMASITTILTATIILMEATIGVVPIGDGEEVGEEVGGMDIMEAIAVDTVEGAIMVEDIMVEVTMVADTITNNS